MEHLVLTDNVKTVLIIVYSFLIFTILLLKFMQKCGKNVHNYIIRFQSFLFIVLFFNITFSINKIVAFCGTMLICYLCLKEFLSLIPTRQTDRGVLLLAYWSIPAQFYFIYIQWTALFYLFVPLYMLLLLSVSMVVANNTNGFLKTIATLQWGLMVTVYAMGYLAMFVIIPDKYNPVAGSIGLLTFILLFTVINDFIQMVFGKMIGKHKILPKISPNKTWEGFLCGVAGSTILAAVAARYLTPLTLGQAIFAGFVLSIAGFFGDVTMSAIKRDLGVKDTSMLIPGHGGILDRLDSLIFTAPLFFHYIAYLNTIVFTKAG